MKMKRGAVLLVNVGPIHVRASAHDRGIDRNEQVATGTGGQHVGELDADRVISLGNNHRSQILGLGVPSISCT